MISAVGCGCHSEPVCKTLRTLAVKDAGLSMSQHAITAGMTIEFDYKAEGKAATELVSYHSLRAGAWLS